MTVLDYNLEASTPEWIERLRQCVLDRIKIIATPWKEILSEFEDEHAYLSISLTKHPEEQEPSVLIEFGVQDQMERHATGFFVAQWLAASKNFGRIERVALEGKPCELVEFITRLSSYLDLPATRSDIVEPLTEV